MVAIWMAVFFATTALLAWLIFFPATRTRIGDWRARAQGAVAAGLSRMATRAASRAHGSSAMVRQAGDEIGQRLYRQRYLLLGTLLLIGLPPWLILHFRQQVALDGFDPPQVSAASTQIIELMRGERLVPPPPLPPEVFVVAEATRAQLGAQAVMPEKIASADRRWNLIDPDLQQRVLAIYRIMREQHGYEMALVEGYRSPERQAELAREGKATRAGPGQSCHQYGLAVDSAPLRDGKLQWDMADPWTRRGYALYGQLAQQAGLRWGGTWKGLKDYVHVETERACRDARRAAGRL